MTVRVQGKSVEMPLGSVLLGDCLTLLAEFPPESIDLVYLDPPFMSGRDWGAFDDRWGGGISEYLTFMRERLVQLHHILKPAGSLYLHSTTALLPTWGLCSMTSSASRQAMTNRGQGSRTPSPGNVRAPTPQRTSEATGRSRTRSCSMPRRPSRSGTRSPSRCW